jgi:hypothetical protein
MEKHIKAGNLPTAEEFLKEAQSNPTKGWTTHKAMIEFAKLHVEAALKAASEKALLQWASCDFYDNTQVVSKSSILNAYPLTKIK